MSASLAPAPQGEPGGGAGGGSLALALASLLLTAAGLRVPANPLHDWIERAELGSYDARVRFQGGVPFRDDLVCVVAIDDVSLKALAGDPQTAQDSKWPLPNTFHARVLEHLLSRGARAVAFDLLSFANPSRPRYRDEDLEFGARARASGRVVLASKFEHRTGRSWHGGQEGMGTALEVWTVPARPFAGIPHGLVNAPLDLDGWVRRAVIARERLAVMREFGLAVEAVRLSGLGPPPTLDRSELSLRWIAFSDPAVLVRNTIRYADVLLSAGAPPGTDPASPGRGLDDLAQRVRGRIVLVGPTFAESHDVHPTPFYRGDRDNPTPGVFIHAMVASNLLSGVGITRYRDTHELALAFAWLVVGAVLAWRAPPRLGYLLVLALAAGHLAAAFLAFSSRLSWVPVVSPLAVLALAYVPQTALRLAASERRRALIKRMFSAYVSREVFEYVEANPKLLKLEGERREATVFFSDVAGFTTISETLSPERLAALLNVYLTPMARIVMEHRGYVDKYIGDAVMAVYGVPAPDADHALHACAAAVRQVGEIERLSSVLQTSYGVTLRAKMGINTGTVSAGNMGSIERLQYTVMGDVVNQASRFEGANKIFGSTIMIGESTYRASRGHVVARRLARLTVKGKHEAVVVYELLGMKDGPDRGLDGGLEALVTAFEAALACWEAGQTTAARAGFERCLELRPGDGPSVFYLEKARAMESGPVPPGWTGEIKLDSK